MSASLQRLALKIEDLQDCVLRHQKYKTADLGLYEILGRVQELMCIVEQENKQTNEYRKTESKIKTLPTTDSSLAVIKKETQTHKDLSILTLEGNPWEKK